MMRKFAVLTCAAVVAGALSVASAPAFSFPGEPVKTGSSIMLVKNNGDGKNWNKHGNNKNWNNNGNNKNWNKNGGKKWSKYGKWHGGDRYRGGYWRNGIFVTLPFVIGDQCYDYLDWRDGVPRPGWYWVC
jgi:hypothetical protein